MSHDRLPYEIRKGSNVINSNPVETVKIPRLTHDELLDKLNLVWDRDPEETQWELIEKLRNALRAVVELPMETDAKSMNHRPKFSSEEEAAVWFCKYGYATAMNQVIQAIEKELG